MSDYNVKVTFRNARILNAIKDAGYESQAECARAIGMKPQTLNGLVAMREAPVGTNGNLSSHAKQLLEGLCLLPEDLWTDHQLYMKVPKNSGEFDINEKDMILVMENKEQLKVLLKKARLTPRQLNVLKQRFVNDKDLCEVGEEIKCSRERVRQIEMKAIRKMREAAEDVKTAEEMRFEDTYIRN